MAELAELTELDEAELLARWAASPFFCEYLRATGLDLGCMSVWEPACGRGHMAQALAEYFGTVRASDIHPYRLPPFTIFSTRGSPIQQAGVKSTPSSPTRRSVW